MKPKQFAILSLFVIVLTVLTACGGAPAMEESAPLETSSESGYAEPAEPAAGYDNAMGAPSVAGESERAGAMPVPTAGIVYQTVPDTNSAPRQQQAAASNRLIIKNAEVSILVEDSDVAIDRLTQVVGDVGGYIVSSRVWYQPHADGERVGPGDAVDFDDVLHGDVVLAGDVDQQVALLHDVDDGRGRRRRRGGGEGGRRDGRAGGAPRRGDQAHLSGGRGRGGGHGDPGTDIAAAGKGE